jgi:hypothetical protein
MLAEPFHTNAIRQSPTGVALFAGKSQPARALQQYIVVSDAIPFGTPE